MLIASTVHVLSNKMHEKSREDLSVWINISGQWRLSRKCVCADVRLPVSRTPWRSFTLCLCFVLVRIAFYIVTTNHKLCPKSCSWYVEFVPSPTELSCDRTCLCVLVMRWRLFTQKIQEIYAKTGTVKLKINEA